MTRLPNKRKLQMQDAPPKTVDEELIQKIEAVYRLNKELNKITAAHKKERAALYQMMKDRKVDRKVLEAVEIAGSKVSIEAIVSKPKSEVANVEKLQGLVTKKVFMQIISATKTNIEKFAGKAVFEQVKEEHEGEENVSVKELKI